MMTSAQKDYAQNVAIATLIGGLVGGLTGQFASKPASMGKTALGVVLGAGVVGASMGLYLRTGGAPGSSFAGLGSVNRYPHMRTTMARLASCTSCGPGSGPVSGYEVSRRKTMAGIQAFRGTYEVAPGSCAEF